MGNLSRFGLDSCPGRVLRTPCFGDIFFRTARCVNVMGSQIDERADSGLAPAGQG